jgi:hypothetical protein
MIDRRVEYGQPLKAGGMSIIPESQVMSHDNRLFGMAWKRPSALLVQDGDGIYRLPIRDITRMIQVGLLLVSGMLLAAAGFTYLQNRRRG